MMWDVLLTSFHGSRRVDQTIFLVYLATFLVNKRDDSRFLIVYTDGPQRVDIRCVHGK